MANKKAAPPQQLSEVKKMLRHADNFGNNTKKALDGMRSLTKVLIESKGDLNNKAMQQAVGMAVSLDNSITEYSERIDVAISKAKMIAKDESLSKSEKKVAILSATEDVINTSQDNCLLVIHDEYDKLVKAVEIIDTAINKTQNKEVTNG